MVFRNLTLVLIAAVLAAAPSAGWAADESHYQKKTTATETMVASFEARIRADVAAGKALQIPRFDSGDFTVMLWFKAESNGLLFTKTNAKSPGNPGTYELHIGDMKPGRRAAVQFQRNNYGNLRVGPRSRPDQWSHLAVTQTGAEQTIYFDGRKVGGRDTSRYRRDVQKVPNDIFQIGSAGLTGLVDELCIYNRALTVKEVKAHADGAAPAKGAGLIAHLPFEGDAKDSSGAGNDATETVACQFAPGKVGKAVKLGKASRVVLPALNDRKFLAGLRTRVANDFPAEKLALEQEAEDDIWGIRWTPGDVKALARRYAAAARRSAAIQTEATAAAAKASDVAGLAAVRALYLKSRRSYLVGDVLKVRDPAQAIAMTKALAVNGGVPVAAALAVMTKLQAEANSWVERKIDTDRIPSWQAEFDIAARQLVATSAEGAEGLAFDKILFVKRFKYQSNHYYTDFINSKWMPGGNLCILDMKTGKVREIVKELKDGIFGRYDLSFDAKRIVFAWKKADQEGYRIYEVNVDGTGLRQLTFPEPNEAEIVRLYRAKAHYHHGTDDMDPCYLPDGGICFISTRCQYGILCDAPDDFTTTVLYRMDGDGKNMEKLTNSSVSEATPSVTPDGRILYTRWEYVDKGAVSVKCLWAMRPDGSGSLEVYGNDISLPPTMAHPRSLPGESNRYVFTGTPHYPQNSVGTIIRIDMSKDIRSRDPMTYMTPGVDVRGERGWWWESSSPAKQRLFKDPFPLSGEFFLVTMGAGGHAVYRNTTAWGLYLLHESGNVMHLYDDDPNIGCFMPMPLRPRTKPPILSAVIDPRLAAKGQAVCMVTDVYHGMEDVKRGSIKYIRVNEQVPRPWASRRRWGGDGYDQQHVVITKDTNLGLKVQHGIVPVEPDGSAHFVVPADANIFFQALDENYLEVQRERTYVNYRPGETRSCVGCHETPNDSPPAAKSQPLAFRRAPNTAGPQPGEKSGARPLYYPVDVQPVLDRHCVKCHSGESPKGDLNLSGTPTGLFSVSYESLVRERRGGKGRRRFDLFPTIGENHPKTGNVSYLPTRSLGSHNSVLIAMLAKDKVKLKDPAMAEQAAKLAKVHAKVNLPLEDMIRLTTWVDSNGQFYGAWWGRRNLQHKDHPNYRPVPTFKSATSYVSPIPEDQR